MAVRHLGEADGLRTFRNPEQHAGVLHREESFGNDEVEVDGQDEGGKRDQKCDDLVAQHELDAFAVLRDDVLEKLLRLFVELVLLFRWRVLQQLG